MKTIYFVFAFAILLVDPASASNLGYRGIMLESSTDQALAAARKQFESVSSANREYEDMVHFTAGDSYGFRNGDCPVDVTRVARPNCLYVRVNLRDVGGEIQTVFVTAKQSFSPAISLSSLMNRIQATYGLPTASYKPVALLSFPVQESIGLPKVFRQVVLWGGKTPPKGLEFSVASIPAEEAEAIGGQYVKLSLYTFEDLVIGFELNVMAADRLTQANRESMQRLRNERERMRQQNTTNLKF